MSKLALFLTMGWLLFGSSLAHGDDLVFKDIIEEANRLYQRGGRTVNVIAGHRVAVAQVAAVARQSIRPLEGERFRQSLSSCVFMRRGISASHLNEGDHAAVLAEFELFLERMRTRGVREYFRIDAPSAALWAPSAPLVAPCVLGIVVGDQVLLLRSQGRQR